jgi:hypothetical protein
VGRVHHFHVGLVISLPDLPAESLVGIDKFGILAFEGANGHGIGHGDSERVVEIHLFLDVREMAPLQ